MVSPTFPDIYSQGMENSRDGSEDKSLVESMQTSSAVEDAAVLGTNAVLNLVRLFGGAMSSTFSGMLAASDKRRQETWLLQLATAVDRLLKRENHTMDDVVSDEGFTVTVVRGVRIVRETESTEKLLIVKNAVCNSGSWAANEEAVQSFFMRLLERYEPEHVFLLKAFDDPQEFIQVHGSAVGNGEMHWIFANIVYKGIVQWEPLAEMVLRDLGKTSLFRTDSGLDLA